MSMTINDIFRLYQTEAGDADAGGGNGGGADDKGAGGEADKGGAGDGGVLGAADAAAKAAKEAEAAKNSGKTQRPDNVPEQFWDAEKGAVKNDAVIKSWQDTRAELKAAKEAAKGSGKAPEKAEDYKFTMPVGSDGKPVPVEIKDNDPAMGIARAAAHKANISQEQFNTFMSEFITGSVPHLPAPVDHEAEKAKLGPNADAIVHATLAWVDGFVTTGMLSKDERDELVFMGSSAVGIRALNKIRESTGEKSIPLDGAVQEGLPSKAELYAMVADPKYQNDEAFRQNTDAMFVKVFGTHPAGTSERGMGVGSAQVAKK